MKTFKFALIMIVWCVALNAVRQSEASTLVPVFEENAQGEKVLHFNTAVEPAKPEGATIVGEVPTHEIMPAEEHSGTTAQQAQRKKRACFCHTICN